MRKQKVYNSTENLMNRADLVVIPYEKQSMCLV